MSTVLLLLRNARVADHLRDTIAAEPGLDVVGSATTLAQAREILARITPDIVVADLLLPDGNLRPLLNQLRDKAGDAGPSVLVLSMSAEDVRLVDALRQGAVGYFAVGRSQTTLVGAIEQVLNGESPMSPQIARAVKAHFDGMTRDATDFVAEAQNPLRLRDADQQLLQRTAEGYVVSEVAHHLQASEHEVWVRMRNIYRKLQFDLRADALTLNLF